MNKVQNYLQELTQFNSTTDYIFFVVLLAVMIFVLVMLVNLMEGIAYLFISSRHKKDKNKYIGNEKPTKKRKGIY